MINQIFSVCLDRDINIEFQSFEQNVSCSGIINYDDGFWCDVFDCINNVWNIMYFYGNRIGGFQKYDFCVWLNMLCDISVDEWVELVCCYVQFVENFVVEILVGFIGCVGYQDVVVLFNECQNGVGDCCCVVWEECVFGVVFQFIYGFLE